MWNFALKQVCTNCELETEKHNRWNDFELHSPLEVNDGHLNVIVIYTQYDSEIYGDI